MSSKFYLILSREIRLLKKKEYVSTIQFHICILLMQYNRWKKRDDEDWRALKAECNSKRFLLFSKNDNKTLKYYFLSQMFCISVLYVWKSIYSNTRVQLSCLKMFASCLAEKLCMYFFDGCWIVFIGYEIHNSC